MFHILPPSLPTAMGPGLGKGIYREGNQVMWEGFPVPRVENLNGVDYYISLDKDHYINIMDNTMRGHSINIISPLSGNSIGATSIPLDSKLNIMKEYANWPWFNSP